MLNRSFFKKLKNSLHTYAERRREVIKLAGDAQHRAKRAIFALQREEAAAAESSLQEARQIFAALQKRYRRDPELFEEGSYRAALEEYVEACLFRQFVQGQVIGPVPGLTAPVDVYLGGLCDLPGEILRYAVRAATARQRGVVERCFKAAEAIVGELIAMDLTGFNRQKFDQAKHALQRLEQVVYDLSLKS